MYVHIGSTIGPELLNKSHQFNNFGRRRYGHHIRAFFQHVSRKDFFLKIGRFFGTANEAPV